MELVPTIATVAVGLVLFMVAFIITRRITTRHRPQSDYDLEYRIVAIDHRGTERLVAEGIARCIGGAIPDDVTHLLRVRESRIAGTDCVAFTVTVQGVRIVIDEINIPADSFWTAERILRQTSFTVRPSGYPDGSPLLSPPLVAKLGYLY